MRKQYIIYVIILYKQINIKTLYILKKLVPKLSEIIVLEYILFYGSEILSKIWTGQNLP